jgi:CYTH domain-containing protein
MNKTAETELHRLFLIERLPEPLTPASAHLQIFDGYIANTRLRLRQVRDPYSNTWTRMLQSRFTTHDDDLAESKLAEINLDEAEFGILKSLTSDEIRKNRYFHEFDLVSVAFDVYLGPLWGLNTARVDFQDRGELDAYIPPPFAIYEVSNDPFFDGANLVKLQFSDVQSAVARLGPLRAAASLPDE